MNSALISSGADSYWFWFPCGGIELSSYIVLSFIPTKWRAVQRLTLCARILNACQLTAVGRCGIDHGKRRAQMISLPRQRHQSNPSGFLHHPLCCCKFLWMQRDVGQWQRTCLCKLFRCPQYPKKVSSLCTAHCPGSCLCSSNECARHGSGARKCIFVRMCTLMGGPRNSYRPMWGTVC